MGMKREDLQSLAVIRLADATLLLENQRYSSAYYLAGYSVELGLKACVARQIRQNEIPDKAMIRDVLTHRFGTLVNLAGLGAELGRAQDADRRFQANWGLASEWSPDVRYDIIDALSAQVLISAIGDPAHGVLKWIREHW